MIDLRLGLWAWVSTSVAYRLERLGLLEPSCYCYYGSCEGDPRDFQPDPDPAMAGLGTVLCEHHRRNPCPVPVLLRARRRLLACFRSWKVA